MKKILYVAFVAIVGVCFVSCNKKQKDFYLSDLQGLWLEDGTKHYVNFTTESAAEDYQADFMWGYEWDEADSVFEDLVLNDRHKNGWFVYRLTKDELLELHKTGEDWADIPKVYTMVVLTSSKMTYHRKDYKDEKVNFTKQQ